MAIKKDNSNATEHYSYLFELFVALRANLARPKGSLDEAALVTAASANEHVSQSWARFGLENSEDEDVEWASMDEHDRVVAFLEYMLTTLDGCASILVDEAEKAFNEVKLNSNEVASFFLRFEPKLRKRRRC